MSELDKVKEEIGWLKIVFALLIAVDISIVGWAAQNFSKASGWLLLTAFFAFVLNTLVIAVLNRSAYRKIDQLEKL